MTIQYCLVGGGNVVLWQDPLETTVVECDGDVSHSIRFAQTVAIHVNSGTRGHSDPIGSLSGFVQSDADGILRGVVPSNLRLSYGRFISSLTAVTPVRCSRLLQIEPYLTGLRPKQLDEYHEAFRHSGVNPGGRRPSASRTTPRTTPRRGHAGKIASASTEIVSIKLMHGLVNQHRLRYFAFDKRVQSAEAQPVSGFFEP